MNTALDISNLVKRIVKLALPMAGSRLIQMLSGFVGMLMLAHLGHQVLAAGALMTSTLITIIVVAISILFSISVVVGQAYGARKLFEIGTIVQQGSILALLLSIPVMILFWFVNHILLWAHQLPNLVHYIRQYFHALEWGVPAFMVLSCLQQTCYGMLKQRLVIILNVICLLIFIALAYVLIFGKLSFSSYGVGGLAYALDIQGWLNIGLLLLSFYFIDDFKPLELFKKRNHEGWLYMRQLFQIGWPMSLQFGGELFAFFMISIMVGWLGTTALAAMQVVQQCFLLFIVPMFAIAEATGILVSQSLGSKRLGEVKHIANICIITALSLVVIFSLIFILFPKVLASFYINIHDPENAVVLHLIVTLFFIMAFALIFDTVRNIASGALRGFYDTRFAMWTGLIIVWVIGLPLGYSLAFPVHLGVIGFQIGNAAAFFIGALAVVWHWRQKLRREFQRA